MLVCALAMLSRPTVALACPISGGGLSDAQALFLGRLTALRPVPVPTGTFKPLYAESTASFDVLRVFEGAVGSTITLLTTDSSMKIGEVYAVPVFGTGSSASAGAVCGPQPEAGNSYRRLGAQPQSEHPAWALGLGVVSILLGIAIGLGPKWWRRRRSAMSSSR